MTLRYLKLTLFSLFFFTGILSAAKPAQKEKSFFSIFEKENPAYLFCYTKDDGADGLHLSYSHDGIVWRSINHGKSLLKPTAGKAKTMNNPSIVQDINGIFHMIWETGSNNSIGYATSKDLINWSEQKELQVMGSEATVLNASAPELYYDKLSRSFQIMWATTIPGRFPETEKADDGFNNRFFYTTTTDFNTFSKTKLLFDSEFPVNDACIFKRKGLFFLFFKNELNKKIQYASSRRIKSFSSTVSEPISGKNFAKSPTAVQIGKYTYVYWEDFMDKHISGVRCKNIKKPVWEDVTAVIHFPTKGNGSVFKINNNTLLELQKFEKIVE
jgi:hypothetical protein